MQVQKKQALQKKIHTMYTEFTNSQLMFIQLPNLRNVQSKRNNSFWIPNHKSSKK